MSPCTNLAADELEILNSIENKQKKNPVYLWKASLHTAEFGFFV